MTTFETLLQTFTTAVENADRAGFAALFTDDAYYHDGVFGEVIGGKAIGDMMVDLWWRDAQDYRWSMFEPAFQATESGGIGYAHYYFSFNSKMKHSTGKHVIFQGVSQFRLRDGRICGYREWGDTLPSYTQLGVPGDILVRSGNKVTERYRNDPAVIARHL